MSSGFPSSAGNPSPSPQGPYNVTVVGIRLFLIIGAVVFVLAGVIYWFTSEAFNRKNKSPLASPVPCKSAKNSMR